MTRRNQTNSGEGIEPSKNTDLRTVTREKLWYVKLGTGSLRMLGKIIKPNERFQAYPEDIPKAFADLIKCLEDEEVQKLVANKNKEYHVPELLYELKEDESGGWWVVNGASKKPINPKPLTQVAAVTLQNSVNS